MMLTKQVHLSGWQNGDEYMRTLYDDCHNYIQNSINENNANCHSRMQKAVADARKIK